MKVLLAILAMFMMLGVAAAVIANAESHTDPTDLKDRMTAIVSFNSTEQLLAITDSIAGVQDTAWLDTLFTCRKNVRFQVTQCVSVTQRCEFRDAMSFRSKIINQHVIFADTTLGEVIITWEVKR